jgi:F0F1-type ATP synthase assembly protein I
MPLARTFPVTELNRDAERSRMAGALRRLVLRQIAIALLAALVLGGFFGQPVALGVFLGGAAVFLPASLSAFRMWVSKTDDPHVAWRTQVSAQTLKWVGTVLVFGATFVWLRQVPAPWVFLGFGLTHLVYWVSMLTER